MNSKARRRKEFANKNKKTQRQTFGMQKTIKIGPKLVLVGDQTGT
jgi:hypothetical protein